MRVEQVLELKEGRKRALRVLEHRLVLYDIKLIIYRPFYIIY